jgi:Leucine-rich repeat (LRR) protein
MNPVDHRHAVAPFRLAAPIAALFLCSVISGCGGKVPTWDEMTTQQAPPAPPGKTIPNPSSVAQAEDPAQTVAWFKGLPPNQINDQALTRLTSMKSRLGDVNAIDARGSTITDDGLAMLAKLPALRSLVLDSTGVTDKGITSLQGVPSLQSLSLNSTRVTDAGLGALALLPGLTRLELMNCDLTAADFVAVGKLPAIEVLILDRVRELDDAGLDQICNASTLKSLHLDECVGLSDKGLVALAKAPGLEEVLLNKSGISGVGLGQAVAKGGLKSLKVLAVSATPISLPGARAINSIKSLESLNISHIVGMNDVYFVEFVEGMKNLKDLNIEGSKGITGQGFAKIKVTANSLETINAKDSGILDPGLGFLKGHKKLKFIDLSNTPVTLAGVQQFKKLVPTCELLYAGNRY